MSGDMTSLERFYENYLVHKVEWLKKFQPNPRECYILRHIVRRLDGTKEPRKSEKETVNLPRGLFADPIKQTVQEKFPNEFASLPERANSTFIIQKFHEWNNDGSQFFYNQPLDANSSTLSRLMKFLASEKQTDLHSPWIKNPSLNTLYSIAKAMPKLPKTNGNATTASQQVDPLEKIRRLQDQINDPTLSRAQRENARMDLDDARKQQLQNQQRSQKGKKATWKNMPNMTSPVLRLPKNSNEYSRLLTKFSSPYGTKSCKMSFYSMPLGNCAISTAYMRE